MINIWQYGSNMHEERLNSSKRLDGAAKFVGLAIKRGYKLAFTHTNTDGIGVSDIVKSSPKDHVIGCLFEIPERKLRKLDSIEGVNSGSYRKLNNFVVKRLDASLIETGEDIEVITYEVVNKEHRPRTNSEYANHILEGIREHKIGIEYFLKVRDVILENNPNIEADLACFSHC